MKIARKNTDAPRKSPFGSKSSVPAQSQSNPAHVRPGWAVLVSTAVAPLAMLGLLFVSATSHVAPAADDPYARTPAAVVDRAYISDARQYYREMTNAGRRLSAAVGGDSARRNTCLREVYQTMREGYRLEYLSVTPLGRLRAHLPAPSDD